MWRIAESEIINGGIGAWLLSPAADRKEDGFARSAEAHQLQPGPDVRGNRGIVSGRPAKSPNLATEIGNSKLIDGKVPTSLPSGSASSVETSTSTHRPASPKPSSNADNVEADPGPLPPEHGGRHRR